MIETTQPDPEAVAWMRGCRSNLPVDMDAGAARMETIREYRNAHRQKAALLGLRALLDAYQAVTREPATVADVPAGQGPASLFIRAGFRGINEVVYKRSDGTISPKVSGTGPEDAAEALWEHLAATLPTVTAEENK